MPTEPNTLSADEKSQDFRLLFDGKTTSLWRNYGKTELDPKWKITGDALMFHPDPEPKYGHDIISVDQFTSFELRIEWKLWAKGNSGIMYHVQETPGESPFKSGPEIQLLDDEAHGGLASGVERLTGACYDLYAPSSHVARPIGEWNDVVLTVRGDHVTHHLNGVKVCDYVLGSEDWNQRVGASKFKDWPAFAAKRRGHICLQDHLNPVAFRNIRVREF